MYRTYRHKSDPRMTIEQSYPWMNHGLLMNEERLVILIVDLEQFENNESWELIEENKKTYA